MTTKTNEEIEALKQSWKKDPCWDIEDSDGFEAYRAELIAWREQYEAECEAKNKEREDKRAAFVREQTGVLDADIISALSTWNEIERMVSSQDKYIGEFETHYQIVMAELQITQIRATLLQAAQLKRIADALERMAEVTA